MRAYRLLNYWGWLEGITPQEASWQVEQMHKAGLGGYVAHSCGGLGIPYMGEQWMNAPWVSPPDFSNIKEKWNDEYCFVRFGIEGGIRLEIYQAKNVWLSRKRSRFQLMLQCDRPGNCGSKCPFRGGRKIKGEKYDDRQYGQRD